MTIVAFVAGSIDGRISLKRKKMPDWTSVEDWRFLQQSLTRCDAVVVGRNTYESARHRLRKRRTYVITSRINRRYTAGTSTFVNPVRVDILDILGEHTRVAILGGSGVYGFFFEHNLVDELYLTIEPYIFGHGIPLVTHTAPIKRLLLCCVKHLNKKGALLLHYKKYDHHPNQNSRIPRT